MTRITFAFDIGSTPTPFLYYKSKAFTFSTQREERLREEAVEDTIDVLADVRGGDNSKESRKVCGLICYFCFMLLHVCKVIFSLNQKKIIL
jgi:hypothetical protein